MPENTLPEISEKRKSQIKEFIRRVTTEMDLLGLSEITIKFDGKKGTATFEAYKEKITP